MSHHSRHLKLIKYKHWRNWDVPQKNRFESRLTHKFYFVCKNPETTFTFTSYWSSTQQVNFDTETLVWQTHDWCHEVQICSKVLLQKMIHIRKLLNHSKTEKKKTNNFTWTYGESKSQSRNPSSFEWKRQQIGGIIPGI